MATAHAYSRRQFLIGATGAALSSALTAPTAMAFAPAAPPLRGRFITHVSVVRVNQIEVTPT